MDSKVKSAVFLAVAALLLLVTVIANDWFIQTMPRRQTLQLPALFASGVLAALAFPKIGMGEASWRLAALILTAGSLIFWMLPRSIDSAVVDAALNRALFVNMVTVGFLCSAAMRRASLEMQTAFLGMIAAMLLATGFALRSFDILLCASFTISQQKETGFHLLGIALALFITTVIRFIRSLKRRTDHLMI